MPDDSLMSLVGNRIRRLRKREGWKQADLADRVGKSTTTVHRWEKGIQMASVEDLMEVADALGIDPATLVTLEADDYRRAMEEAATIVEGGLEELVEELRRRSESAPATPTSPVSEEGGSGEGPHAGEGVGENE